jgi:hypothetical protein
MRKKRRGTKIPFVAVSWEILNSKAYIDLPASAGKALPYFLGKTRSFFNDPQYHLIEFKFSYAEGKRLGFAPGTFSKIIQALVQVGFVDPVDKGGLRSDGKCGNIFNLSARWRGYGTPEFQSINWRCFFPRSRASKPEDRVENDSKKNNRQAMEKLKGKATSEQSVDTCKSYQG